MARAIASTGLVAKEMLEVAPRSIRLSVQPAPANLSERRSVLRMIQKYGEVEMFKKQADNSTFVTIVSSVETANKLIEKSHIPYELITDSKFDAHSAMLNSNEITAPIQPIERSREQVPHRRTSSLLTQKTFSIRITPYNTYDHMKEITSSPLYNAWPVRTAAGKESFVYNALKKVVPASMATEGLCDWDTGDQFSNDPSEARPAETFSYDPRVEDERKASSVETNLSALAEAVRRVTERQRKATRKTQEEASDSVAVDNAQVEAAASSPVEGTPDEVSESGAVDEPESRTFESLFASRHMDEVKPRISEFVPKFDYEGQAEIKTEAAKDMDPVNDTEGQVEAKIEVAKDTDAVDASKVAESNIYQRPKTPAIPRLPKNFWKSRSG